MFQIKDKARSIRGVMPAEFDEYTMYALIKSVIDEELNCANGRVRFDFKKLERIGAGGVAVLSNAIELLKRSGVEVEYENLDRKCKAYKQLRDFGFVQKYLNGALPERSVWRLPLRIVHGDGIYAYITNDLIPWVSAAFDTEDEYLSTVTVSFQEIFNNIVDHSTVDIGCACAQFDKRKGLVRICVSDFGVGIPRKVRTALPDIQNDATAIAKACEQGFTTQSTPRNRGAGLHVVMNSMVNANKGTVAIYSNCGIYSIKRNAGMIKTSVRTSEDFYPGTMFFVTLNASDFVPPAKEERFQW